MRILLFDHDTAGHHLEYAGHIARYLSSAGDDVMFATWDKPPSPTVSSVDEMFRKVTYLGDDGASSALAKAAGWPIVRAQGVHRSLRLATLEGVDAVHFLCLDRSELAVLASLSVRTRRPAVFGTLFWPYFIHEAHETVSGGKQLFHLASRLALRRLLREDTMDALFVHSERIKSLLLSLFSDPSLTDRICVVPDPAKEAPEISMEQARASLGLPGRVPVILFFGDLRLDKGPDILLEALPRLRGDWAAVLAGAPGIVGEKEAEACRQKLQDSARLLTRFGYVPEEDVNLYFRAADVVVLPYRTIFKGTSGVLRRAAASGKPVIASDVGDVGPDVREAGLGTVIPPESQENLVEALQDFLERREDVKREVEPRAHDYAQGNDWRLLGRATRAVYASKVESQRQ